MAIQKSERPDTYLFEQNCPDDMRENLTIPREISPKFEPKHSHFPSKLHLFWVTYKLTFSSETSQMVSSKTLLFLKINCGSKKRQKTPKQSHKDHITEEFRSNYWFFVKTTRRNSVLSDDVATYVFQRNFRSDVHWNITIFENQSKF